jgi:hypothetical protein
MQKIILALVIAVSATGCATVQKVSLDTGSSAALKGQTLVQTTRSKPDFAAMSATKAALGMFGAVAAVSEGNTLVNTNQVADPALAISATLARHLQSVREVQLVEPAVLVDSTDPATIAAAAKGKARYVLDVQTTNWMFSHFPTDWTHYRVIHSAQARLIDVESKTLLAQGTCSFMPEFSDSAPTYDDLVNNQASGLKQQMQLAVDNCVKKLKAETLVL